jgi:2'-5' RNA ligase
MARLFVAIDLPENARERIANLCTGVRGARWVRFEQLHLTLRFIGDATDRQFHAIEEALSCVRGTPFEIRLVGVGHFPPRGRPRVLWVGIEPSSELLALQESVERNLQKAGIAPERRKFHPHITVARLRDGASAQDIIPFLSANGMFALESFTVNEFRLYSSILRPEGAVHTIEAEYPLEDYTV